MQNTKFESHEISLIFPRMTTPELAELSEHIKEHGLQEDIVIYEGKILDGTNRYTACMDIGITPRFRKFGSRATDGTSPTAFVNAHNLQRRNLKNASQRAALAAKLLPYFQAETLAKGGGDSLSMAAAATGASRTNTAAASTLAKQDPEEFEKVATGQQSLAAAVSAADAKKNEDKAKKNQDAKEIRNLKREHLPVVRELHGGDFADAFDKGVILKKLDELKLFIKQDPAMQLSIAPLITRHYAVKSAIKMMSGELSGEDSIATLIVRAISFEQTKKGKLYKISIDGFTITVRKTVENGD